jgi:hypothetical protein
VWSQPQPPSRAAPLTAPPFVGERVALERFDAPAEVREMGVVGRFCDVPVSAVRCTDHSAHSSDGCMVVARLEADLYPFTLARIEWAAPCWRDSTPESPGDLVVLQGWFPLEWLGTSIRYVRPEDGVVFSAFRLGVFDEAAVQGAERLASDLYKYDTPARYQLWELWANHSIEAQTWKPSGVLWNVAPLRSRECWSAQLLGAVLAGGGSLVVSPHERLDDASDCVVSAAVLADPSSLVDAPEVTFTLPAAECGTLDVSRPVDHRVALTPDGDGGWTAPMTWSMEHFPATRHPSEIRECQLLGEALATLWSSAADPRVTTSADLPESPPGECR